MSDLIFNLLIVVLALMPVLDAAATVFFFRLFMRSRHEAVPGSDAPHWRSRYLQGRSWLLGLLTLAFAIITVALLVIGVLAGRRLFGLEAVPGSSVMVVVVLIFLGGIPPAFMWAFWQSRKRTGTPPPFSEND